MDKGKEVIELQDGFTFPVMYVFQTTKKFEEITGSREIQWEGLDKLIDYLEERYFAGEIPEKEWEAFRAKRKVPRNEWDDSDTALTMMLVRLGLMEFSQQYIDEQLSGDFKGAVEKAHELLGHDPK